MEKEEALLDPAVDDQAQDLPEPETEEAALEQPDAPNQEQK
jgi:hypothetical protein